MGIKLHSFFVLYQSYYIGLYLSLHPVYLYFEMNLDFFTLNFSKNVQKSWHASLTIFKILQTFIVWLFFRASFSSLEILWDQKIKNHPGQVIFSKDIISFLLSPKWTVMYKEFFWNFEPLPVLYVNIFNQILSSLFTYTFLRIPFL